MKKCMNFKDKKIVYITMGIILLIIVLLVILFKLNINENINIFINSKKYDLVDYDDELSNYKLFVYNNERIYFYDKKTKTILDDNSKVIKKVWYGEDSCGAYEEENEENIKCEGTFDFFELFLYDSSNLLVVDKDGYIFHVENEDDIEKESGKYDFYGNYWYGNVKIYKKNTNNEVYIQEIYDSEGGSRMNVIHKDEKGKLNKLYEIVDFVFYEDKYIELAGNKINFFKNGKLIKTNDKYDELYDIYDSKYILVRDNDCLKIIDFAERVLVNFGEDKHNLTDAVIVDEDGTLYVREFNIDGYGTRLYKFDMSGKFEKLEN